MADEIYNEELEENEQGGDIERLREELGEMSEQLSRVEFEKQLAVELTRAGVIDLDAGLKLIGPGVEVEEVVGELKRERPYLFVKAGSNGSGITQGVKVRRKDRMKEKLEKAAESARGSGDRKELYEYLKLRRLLGK